MDRDEIQQLKNSTDIVELIGHVVVLKKSGKNFKGLCPFHREKTPSFTVSPEKMMYHCFGCGEGGDVIRFIQNYRRTDFVDAINRLRRYNRRKA